MNFDDILKQAHLVLPTNVNAIAADFTEEEARNEMRRAVQIVFGCEMLLDSAEFPNAPDEHAGLSLLWRCAHVADVMRENASLKAEVARLNRIVDDPDMMDRADRRWWSLYEKASECRNEARGGFGRHPDTSADVVALARAEARYRRAMARCERIQKGEPAFQVEVSA